jgi:hypothetical protein
MRFFKCPFLLLMDAVLCIDAYCLSFIPIPGAVVAAPAIMRNGGPTVQPLVLFREAILLA